ncbi:unnamed protein product [Spirodela intermedia]|uniref:Uncharacterized protein n=1 Tax=Spirodela intermedia TaxID=51605 RepID=A0A7I8J5W2_SPIIN|nr:unnamed protein product [Spirodela intermedia]CAA6665627.1 unnamed protein product [Spirodela intermedia]
MNLYNSFCLSQFSALLSLTLHRRRCRRWRPSGWTWTPPFSPSAGSPPLLRRHAAVFAVHLPEGRPPFYRSDLKSGPVGNPGVVPFLWEQSAGEPKDKPKANPAAAVQALLGAEHRTRGGDPDEDDDDGIADALETLSRTESCFMTCSISGTAGGEIDGRAPPPGRFSEDPPGRDFVMGRFLPAAQAMASSAPQSAPRRPRCSDAPPQSHRPPPRPTSAGLVTPSNKLLFPTVTSGKTTTTTTAATDEDEGSHAAAAGRSSLLPQQQQQRRAPLRASASDAEDEHIWEEVYEHKLGRVRQKLGEEASRWTSESNQLSFWSDSPTADGLGHRAVNSDEQLRLLDGGGKQTMDDALPAPLPPPLPESPSDSWLSRTLPTLGRKKQTTGASSTDSRVGNYNQGEGDDHGQGAVLVNPTRHWGALASLVTW